MVSNLKYTLLEYQQDALQTAVYPNKGELGGLMYAVLGLVGEAGELANKLKKHLRNGTKVDNAVLRDELGDVLWYVAAVSKELKSNMLEVASENVEKLAGRAREGTLKDREIVLDNKT